MSIIAVPTKSGVAAIATGAAGSPGANGAAGADATDLGLLSDAIAATIPTAIKKVSTRGRSALDVGGAKYVEGTAPTPRSGFTSANSRNFVLSKEQIVVPQTFYDATDTDYQSAMQGAVDYLETFNLNNGSVFYNGAPKLVCPAGSYTLHDRIDFKHSGTVEGEGDGWFGPGSGGCTHFKWTAGAGGFGVQAANTSGITTVDGTTHNGSGGLNLRDMCLEGYFAGTESETHGLVLRNAVKATDLYLKNWPGENIKAWAGTVIGASNVSGNLSTSRFIGIKGEGSRGNIDLRGSDANLITVLNCESYQNRLFGLLDDNGAGSNTYLGTHAASNGLITGTWAQTQCSYSGNRYAARWGGTFTNAPSGTTVDTADWYYIEAGGAITNLIPAWVSTPNTFRAGGDYLTLNSASTIFTNPYSESGGFSQFNIYTELDYGSLTSQYYRGGVQSLPYPSGGKVIKTGRLNNYMSLQTDASEAGFSTANNDGTGGFGYFAFTRGGGGFANCFGGGLNVLQSNVNVGVIDSSGIHGVASVTSISGGVGYATGAGAAVTQLTSKSTATPAINKVCGQVTMNNAALAGGVKVSFVVTNSTVAATDTIIVSIASGGTANAYRAAVTAISAGVSFTVTVENITAGSLSESPVVNFAILKAVAA